mmetsp:Transcript_58497/g.174079  ORF Transcript_58497/g.174079 Transcript_58497/m.174079 type:complete len:255 (-) Transcript_58497:62-826(-)
MGLRRAPAVERGRDAVAPISAKRLLGLSSSMTVSMYIPTVSWALTALGLASTFLCMSFRRDMARDRSSASLAIPWSFIRSHLRDWCHLSSESANETPLRTRTSSLSNSAALNERLGPSSWRQAILSSGTENSRARWLLAPRRTTGLEACLLLLCFDGGIFSFHLGERSRRTPPAHASPSSGASSSSSSKTGACASRCPFEACTGSSPSETRANRPCRACAVSRPVRVHDGKGPCRACTIERSPGARLSSPASHG